MDLTTQLGLLGPLVASLAGVATVTALLTEMAPFGASGIAKRGQAVVYALLLTFVLYSIGGVDIPKVVAPELVNVAWWKFVVLAVASAISALMAMGGADVVQAMLAKRRGDEPPAP